MNDDLISRSALFKAWDTLDETQDPNLLVDAMIKATQDAPPWTLRWCGMGTGLK